MDWHTLSTEEALNQLQIDPGTGLTTDQVEKRLAEYGPNQLVERAAKPAWRIFIDQFKEIMVIVLILAALVSGAMGEWLEVGVILAIVVLNAILGFTQEYRAEQSMAALKKMAVPRVRVRRNGQLQEIPSTRLVPGDVVLVETGNILPADGRILFSSNLKAQEAALTGESEPVDKDVAVLSGEDLVLGDRRNMLYMGTVITYGRGEMLVTETGMNTQLGKIADMIQEVEEESTPLQKRLAGLAKTLAIAALGIIVVVVVLGWMRGQNLEILFLTGISLAVAAIPESLPAVVTITLALGAQRLLKRHTLIRNLPAVETLGSVTVICSDKTGTLTENRMTVTILDVAGNTEKMDAVIERRDYLLYERLVDYVPSEPYALSILIRVGALCNDAVLEVDESGNLQALGDPTEGALLLAARRLGLEKAELENEWPRAAEIPFSSERKRMTTIHQVGDQLRESDLPWRDTVYVVGTKGGLDNVIEICDRVLVDGRAVPLDQELQQRILDANARFASQGQRVLAVSFRNWEEKELPEDLSRLEAEQIFVGLIAMMDPPRPEVKEAVARARTAGIRPVMITGDHPLTAMEIARNLGIAGQDETPLTGQDLARLSVQDLEEVVDHVSVYARVAPEHKLNIVQALQNRGQFAAMTGDGVNDAPALKQADIGVAMGITGTDVSKQAADVVLLDDNFATIVAAVAEGRVIFDNIRKFIKYALAGNTAELMAMLIGPMLGMPLPLLPIQILWINLVTDGLPGVALAEEVGEAGIMKRPPLDPKEGVFSRGIGVQVLWVGALLTVLSLGIGYGFWRMDPSGPWQTMLFTTLVFGQMANVIGFRANRDSLLSIGLFSNRLMVVAVLASILLQLALLYVPFLQPIFDTRPLSAANLLLCVAAAMIVFLAIEVVKLIGRLREPI